MINLTRFLLSVFIFLLIISGVMFVSAGKGNAQGPGCNISIQKQAVPDDGTTFFFRAVIDGAKSEFALVPGDIFELFVGEMSDLEVTESVPSGWKLDLTDCMVNSGVTFTEIENGLHIDCNSSTGHAFCVFRNVQSDTVSQIPALSEWGMIAAAAGLGLIGVFFAVRRKRMQDA